MTTRLPVPDRLLPYEVNELGQVRSIDRIIMRKCRHTWEPTPYHIRERILKYDLKLTNNVQLARVNLYNSELDYRICYYVSRLTYAVFNNKDYDTIPNIHYRDGNSLNCRLDNLYETEEPYTEGKRIKSLRQ